MVGTSVGQACSVVVHAAQLSPLEYPAVPAVLRNACVEPCGLPMQPYSRSQLLGMAETCIRSKAGGLNADGWRVMLGDVIATVVVPTLPTLPRAQTF